MAESARHPGGEWLVERGIGETRAVRLVGGRIAATITQRASDPVRLGAVHRARLGAADRARRQAAAVLECGAPVWLSPPPTGLSEGAPLTVEITRMALAEAGRVKPPRARLAGAGAALNPAPDLAAQLAEGGAAVREVLACADHRAPDELEAAGWSELLDAARTGHLAFPGGALAVHATPAMLLIDVDGDLAAEPLALAAADAAGWAIGALGLAGSIGIDFPTLAGRSARGEVAAALDAALAAAGAGPFERTAVNGFGFLQLIRPRTRPSLVERMQFARTESDALALLRLAARTAGTGPLTLAARGAVIAWLAARPALVAEVERAAGRRAALVRADHLEGAGHAQ